jgi:hypothetical protein
MVQASDATIATKIQHLNNGDALVARTGGQIVIEQGATLAVSGTVVTTTGAELNTLHDSTRYVAAGSTLALTVAANNKQMVKLDTTAGSTVTLPAATGSGARFRFVVSVLATSNSHVVKVANASDFMIGTIHGVSDDPATVKGWVAANSGTVATNSDTITLNRTTTGSVSLGEVLEAEDIAANTWLVSGSITQTGSEVTPFSAGV